MAITNEDESKFRKISKAVALKREKLKKKSPNKFTMGSNLNMWQLKKAFMLMMAPWGVIIATA